MKIWLHGYAESPVLSPSAAISLVAHAAILGGAAYGTGRAPRSAVLPPAEQIFYLPPPDRHPALTPLPARVRYVPMGGANPARGKLADHGVAVGHQVEAAPGVGMEAIGRDATAQTAQPLLSTGDSVFSILSVEESVQRLSGSAAPIYPPDLMSRGVEGTVVTRYVVDTSGRADPLTLQILSGPEPQFVQAVRDAVPGMRFTAALVEGRRVRQLVEQNFQFRITPPPVPSTAAEHTRAVPTP